uniref:Kinesin light chain n=1 Tax=Kalanchoe fedtschenkoi TaxID=63787 RepID=A0A7N0RCG8_KALFE
MYWLRVATSRWLKRASSFAPAIAASYCERLFPSMMQSLRCRKSFCFRADPGGNQRRKLYWDCCVWIAISGQSALLLELCIHPNLVLAKEDIEDRNVAGLQKIEDGAVISNQHTSKWRIFTDQGRELFLQGKLEEAEKFFLLAIQEARDGFGERDPHVASSCNNLAELYRVTKRLNEAEPLYLEAIDILEQSFGPEDIRLGVAFHNIGQFYVAQRKLEEARRFYEHALKIKRRVLGHEHRDYADTMYHLGTVLYLQGEESDSAVLIKESIRILEDGGLGASFLCLRRMRFLARIYKSLNQAADAESLQRKIQALSGTISADNI